MKTKFLQIQSKTFDELGVKTAQELWDIAQKEGYKGLAMFVETSFEKSATAENSFDAVFSTDVEDRHGEIVYQEWDLKHFKKNPVYLDSHNYDSIEHIIGKVTGIKSDKKLFGSIEFALVNPKGKLAFDLANDGFLNTSSVGFIPKAFDEKGNILKSELLEISAVAVPANPEALFEKNVEVTPEPEEIKEENIEETPEVAPVQNVDATEVKKLSKNEIVKNAVSDIISTRKRNLELFNKELKALVETNETYKKRKVFTALRKLLD